MEDWIMTVEFLDGKVKLVLGDCLEKMKNIPDESVDMILCDLPYGTTACSWDVIIPFDKLWEQYERITKTTSCIALVGSEPFSSIMRTSNFKLYKYDWTWVKTVGNGFVHAKNKPLKRHEIVSIFSKGTTVHKSQSKNRMNYYPQMTNGEPYQRKMTGSYSKQLHAPSKGNVEFSNGTFLKNDGTRYPTSVLYFSNGNNHNIHPTQKPVPLLEYLIKTYTLEDEIVLDNTAGVFSTGVACINTNRRFIGIEKDEKYFNLGRERIESLIKSR